MALIIAECCQNHNGDRAILKDMIWAASDAGADYVKMQSIWADELTKRERFEEGVVEDGIQKAIKRPYGAEYARLKPLELDEDAHHWFIEECTRAGVKPMTTVFARSRVPFLAKFPWRDIKVASYDCASLPLLRDLREQFDHIFVSTGATHDKEIEEAVHVLAGHSYTLFHCVTIYPTPLEVVNLARLSYLKKLAPRVGYSDHSLVARDGIKASIAALYTGAEVIERHFTILPSDKTKDGPISINPAQLQDLVKFGKMEQVELKAYVENQIPEYPLMFGESTRELSTAELLNRDYYRGRFASKINEQTIYNWESASLESAERLK